MKLEATMTDLLFLHVPKFNNYYKPFNRFTFINLPPVGLLGLADFLRKNKYSTKIIHLGVEKYKYGEINLSKIITEHQTAIVGLGLHWHFQAFDVIETAKKIKEIRPDVAVVLGGFTASIFAEEILRRFDCIDFVIRGDAEIPLRDLIAQHHSGRDYPCVPNLAFREESTIRMNPISYVGDHKTIDTVSYTDFTLMKDYPTFVDSFSRFAHLNDISEILQKVVIGKRKMFPVFLGRGCVYSCSFCGGSREAQKNINNRKGFCLRSVEGVLDSLRDLQRFGFDLVNFPLDPPPVLTREEFYCEVFEGMKKENISLTVELERYHLPTPKFIKRFRDLLRKDSWITISPGSHNEEIRRKNGLYRYSNAELEECLRVCDEEGVNCLVCFSAGLPFEGEDDLKEMGRYLRRLQREFKRVKCSARIIEVEPASPMSSHSNAYDLTPHRLSFMDYYRYHGEAGRNHFLETGYDRAGCPTPAEMKDMFCRHLCTRFNRRWVPQFARTALCSTAAMVWQSGLAGLLDKIIGLAFAVPALLAAQCGRQSGRPST